MSEALRASLHDGPHARLVALEGRWQGRARTWFEPEVLADTSPVSAHIETLLGGRLLRVVYDSACAGQVVSGHLLVAFHLQRRQWELAWCDTFHTGTQLMALVGDGEVPGGIGSYPAPEGPDWGWRIALEGGDGVLHLRMWNRPPGEPEALAVEFELTRAPDA